jgi:hypothetical protein
MGGNLFRGSTSHVWQSFEEKYMTGNHNDRCTALRGGEGDAGEIRKWQSQRHVDGFERG